jgi:hypothetical protein
MLLSAAATYCANDHQSSMDAETDRQPNAFILLQASIEVPHRLNDPEP